MWSEFDERLIGTEMSVIGEGTREIDPKRLIVNWGSGMVRLFCLRNFSRSFLIHKYIVIGMSLWQLFEWNRLGLVRMDLEGIQQRYPGFLARSDLDPEVDPHELGM